MESDLILKQAYENNIIMSGVSAGAICWFDKGITDSWKNHQSILPCLGFVKEFAVLTMMKSLKNTFCKGNT